MATETYRTEKLAEAEASYQVARAAWEGATTKKARREVAETLEFWGNKVAYLYHAQAEEVSGA